MRSETLKAESPAEVAKHVSKALNDIERVDATLHYIQIEPKEKETNYQVKIFWTMPND